MIDDLVKKYSNFFEKKGDPVNYKEHFDETEFATLCSLYIAYKMGSLREIIAAGLVPRIKVDYRGDIDELINRIKSCEDLDSKITILISKGIEIKSSNDLLKLKNAFPDKEIVVHYDDDLSFIDDAISAAYMIEYYKSIIGDDLSPLEKVTVAYDIVKSFVYNDYQKKGTSNSRQITKIVNTGNIVCLGYANIFNRILRELGIKAMKLSVEIKNEKQHAQHARSIALIKDDKYGIDSCYTFDATFDSADKEYYTHIKNNEFKPVKTEETEGYKKADTFSTYKNFLIPIKSYRSKYPTSYNETIQLYGTKAGQMISKEETDSLLNSYQHDNVKKAIGDKDFAELIYNARLAEGYKPEEIPESIQEALYVSYDEPYSIEAINDVIKEIEQKKSLT